MQQHHGHLSPEINAALHLITHQHYPAATHICHFFNLSEKYNAHPKILYWSRAPNRSMLMKAKADPNISLPCVCLLVMLTYIHNKPASCLSAAVIKGKRAGTRSNSMSKTRLHKHIPRVRIYLYTFKIRKGLSKSSFSVSFTPFCVSDVRFFPLALGGGGSNRVESRSCQR